MKTLPTRMVQNTLMGLLIPMKMAASKEKRLLTISPFFLPKRPTTLDTIKLPMQPGGWWKNLEMVGDWLKMFENGLILVEKVCIY